MLTFASSVIGNPSVIMSFSQPEIQASDDLGLDVEDFSLPSFLKIVKDRYRAMARDASG